MRAPGLFRVSQPRLNSLHFIVASPPSPASSASRARSLSRPLRWRRLIVSVWGRREGGWRQKNGPDQARASPSPRRRARLWPRAQREPQTPRLPTWPRAGPAHAPAARQGRGTVGASPGAKRRWTATAVCPFLLCLPRSNPSTLTLSPGLGHQPFSFQRQTNPRYPPFSLSPSLSAAAELEGHLAAARSRLAPIRVLAPPGGPPPPGALPPPGAYPLGAMARRPPPPGVPPGGPPVLALTGPGYGGG